MADSNLTTLGYVKETVFGTTPAAALQLLRRSGGSIKINQGSVTPDEIRSDLRAGKPVRVSLSGSGGIPIEWSYGTLDPLLEGMLMEEWSTDVLVDGVTPMSYTFEDQFPQLTPAQYLIFKGTAVEGLSMNFALKQIVKGTLDLLSASPSLAQASAGTGPATAPGSTSAWNTVDMITSLEENASGISEVVSVQLNLKRNLRILEQLGSLGGFAIGTGRLMVTGQLQQYFYDARLIDAFFAFENRGLGITVTDDAGNAMLVEVPKMKYEGDLDVGNPGPDGDRLVSVNFTGFADVGDAALVRFTRTPA